MLALKDLSGNSAVFVKLLYGYNILMRCDLEHAVCRGVYDQVTRVNVSLAIISDNLGARVGLIAENATSRPARELVENLLREAVGVGGHSSF